MDVNHFGSSTALLSKHILQTIYVSISFYIFTKSQDLPRPSLSPPPRREKATNWSNSDIRRLNKIFKVYSWYPKIFQAMVSQEIYSSKLTSLLITDKLLCCMFCPTYYDISVFCLNSYSYITGIGWILYTS